jgi:hypothetical protein
MSAFRCLRFRFPQFRCLQFRCLQFRCVRYSSSEIVSAAISFIIEEITQNRNQRGRYLSGTYFTKVFVQTGCCYVMVSAAQTM